VAVFTKTGQLCTEGIFLYLVAVVGDGQNVLWGFVGATRKQTCVRLFVIFLVVVGTVQGSQVRCAVLLHLNGTT
jgi:hypothetical protein